MPRVKLTKSVIDALPTPSKETVHWDTGCPGFGVKITPKGRKIFVVLYRTAGGGSRLRKYTIGPYGRVTLNQARVTAQKVFAAKLEGRDLAAEKKDSRIGCSQTALMIYLSHLSRGTCPKIAPRRTFHECFAGRLGRHGAVEAFTRSPSVT
jgi:hypothetical protein